MIALKTISGHDFWFYKGDSRLVIYLHGLSDSISLNTVDDTGLPRAIQNGLNPAFSVVSPRNSNGDSAWSNSEIDECIDEAVKLGCDPNNIIISGYSNGARGALFYASSNPKYKVKGVFAVSTWLPDTPNVNNLNMFVAMYHSRNDDRASFNKAESFFNSIPGVNKQCVWIDFGKHNGLQSYVFKDDGLGFYSKIDELLKVEEIEDEIIYNPEIIWNKTQGLLIIGGITYKLTEQ